MEVTDITLGNLDDLQNNIAWQFFIEEQSKLLEALSFQLKQPSATSTIEEVRIVQGRIMVAEDNLAWVEITRQQIEEEMNRYHTNKQEEEPSDG